MTQHQVVNERVEEERDEQKRNDHLVIMSAIKVPRKELHLALAYPIQVGTQ